MSKKNKITFEPNYEKLKVAKSALRKKRVNRCDALRKMTEPRYDKIYKDGVKWLNDLGGEVNLDKDKITRDLEKAKCESEKKVNAIEQERYDKMMHDVFHRIDLAVKKLMDDISGLIYGGDDREGVLNFEGYKDGYEEAIEDVLDILEEIKIDNS